VSGVTLDGLGALDRSGLAIVVSQVGGLLGVDAAGNERVRVALEKPPPTLAGGVVGLPFGAPPVDLKSSPPVIVDPVGRIGFVRSNGRAGVVAPSGRVEIASEAVCASPVAVVPAGDRRMLVACHDGRLWMYGE
jgi:hypothetical protein